MGQICHSLYVDDERRLLECVNRDLKYINQILDVFESKKKRFPLSHSEQRKLWIINTIYEQQKYMYDQNIHSCQHKIVSIFQPHVRPIPRGKVNSKIEFEAKLVVSPDNGFSRINTLSWEAYHEAGNLKKQVEAYKTYHGYNLNQIRAILKGTSESWIACIFFIMNLIQYESKYIFDLIFVSVKREFGKFNQDIEINLRYQYKFLTYNC